MSNGSGFAATKDNTGGTGSGDNRTPRCAKFQWNHRHQHIDTYSLQVDALLCHPTNNVKTPKASIQNLIEICPQLSQLSVVTQSSTPHNLDHTPTFSHAAETSALFTWCTTTAKSGTVLEPYLPAKHECCYSLRSQSHERTLINKTTELDSERDYIVRVL